MVEEGGERKLHWRGEKGVRNERVGNFGNNKYVREGKQKGEKGSERKKYGNYNREK